MKNGNERYKTNEKNEIKEKTNKILLLLLLLNLFISLYVILKHMLLRTKVHSFRKILSKLILALALQLTSFKRYDSTSALK
jgi:hypothetical protein